MIEFSQIAAAVGLLPNIKDLCLGNVVDRRNMMEEIHHHDHIHDHDHHDNDDDDDADDNHHYDDDDDSSGIAVWPALAHLCRYNSSPTTRENSYHDDDDSYDGDDDGNDGDDGDGDS